MSNFYKVVPALSGVKIGLKAESSTAQPNYSQESLGSFMLKLMTYDLKFNAYNFYVPEIHSKEIAGKNAKPGYNLSAAEMQGFIAKSNPTFTVTIAWIRTKSGRKFPSPKIVISTLPAPSLNVQPEASSSLSQEIEQIEI